MTSEVEPVDPPQAWIRPLRYRAQPMVRWLRPREIARGIYGEFFGRLFGSFADSRERQAALRAPVVHYRQGPVAGDRLTDLPPDEWLVASNEQLPWHRAAPDGESNELWVDYVADIGDGFSPTFTIAEQMARPITEVEGSDGSTYRLPRADLLLMGGDEVYPAASPDNYRDRTIGPYRMAFPYQPGRQPVPLFAIPGNHDWYDGLSSFLDRFTVFAPGDDASTSRGWSIHQTRSYFAVQVTDVWWVWGIDIALNADIDEPQKRFFRHVAATMPSSGRIMLCTGKPSWLLRRTRSGVGPTAPEGVGGAAMTTDDWDKLTYFLHETLGDKATMAVRLVMSGDKHFYALHQPIDRPDLPTTVVSGGGGAYLASTLEAPEALELSWRFGGEDPAAYTSVEVWPSRGRSLRLGLQALYKLPLLNPEMAGVFGLLAALFALAARAGITNGDENAGAALDRLEPLVDSALWQDQLDVLWGALHNTGGWAVASALALALFVMAKAHRRPTTVASAAAAAHLALHAVAATLSTTLAARVAVDESMQNPPVGPPPWLDPFFGVDRWPTTVFVVGVLLFGSIFGIVAFSLYLVLAQVFRVNLNELFVGMRSRDYKQFVRLRVTDDAIEGHVIGFERVPRRSLRWVDGRPVVEPLTLRPHRIGGFRVEADAGGEQYRTR